MKSVSPVSTFSIAPSLITSHEMLSGAGETLGLYTIPDFLAVGWHGRGLSRAGLAAEPTVAIKVLPSDVAADPLSLERFRREARAVAALSHPNILAIFDFGSDQGIHYAVTELLERSQTAPHLSACSLNYRPTTAFLRRRLLVRKRVSSPCR